MPATIVYVCIFNSDSRSAHVCQSIHPQSGAAESPRVICHVDVCDTLWNMGLHDHLVGYFGCVS